MELKDMAAVATHVLTFIFTSINAEEGRNKSKEKKKQFVCDCM